MGGAEGVCGVGVDGVCGGLGAGRGGEDATHTSQRSGAFKICSII